MAEKDLDEPIHSLIHAESLSDRMEARLELEWEGVSILPRILNELTAYFCELAEGIRVPRDHDITPFLQFQGAFQVIQMMLWSWHEDGQPIIETLTDMQNDSNPRARALATIGLSFGNVRWNQDARIESHLNLAKQDAEALVRVAANFALAYMPFGKYVEAKTAPDMAVMQRIEQYAAQVLSGMAQHGAS